MTDIWPVRAPSKVGGDGGGGDKIIAKKPPKLKKNLGWVGSRISSFAGAGREKSL